MKVVKPSVTLVHCTPQPERVIERMGRICYQSQHKVQPCASCNGRGFFNEPNTACTFCGGTGTDITSAIAFIKMILANGHESVIEHVSAGFLIVTDRGVTHELVRHRPASYSQESTRYCNYCKEDFGGEITVIEPPGLRVGEGFGMADGDLRTWSCAMGASAHAYLKLIARGVSPQIARSVLPNSLKAEIGMTANFREWRHVLRLRTSPKAHPQMREIAAMIRAELVRLSPACFEDTIHWGET